jgi:hypothetical protein
MTQSLSRSLKAASGAAFIALLPFGAAEAEVKGEYVDYMHGGTALSGYLAYDNAVEGPRPGIFLVHDRAGLT